MKNSKSSQAWLICAIDNITVLQDRLDGAACAATVAPGVCSRVARILFDAGELVSREAESYRVNSVLLDRAGFAGIR
ncbi:MAG: hypothetical protein IPN05_00005 [Sulfuritalea sp.]|nr:hypothetical protein [Sulfuritalea sp.]